jgi:endonuclease/exonuclease/phosphatase family metal-dependent hydrolase
VLFPRYEGWEPRGVLDVVVRLGERQIRVLNTHLQVDRGDGEDAAMQREDSAQALALRMRGSSEPVVLMGDFNADPNDPELKPLSGLVDAWAEKGEGSGATIPAFPAEGPSRRIDAILVDQRLMVRSCAVIRSPRTALASDHYPVVADLAFVP